MKTTNDNFFKNFNSNYLIFINIFYNDKSIIYIKNDIKKQIKILTEKNNLNQLMDRNINYWLIRGWSYEDGVNKIKEINNTRKKPENNNILTISYWINRGFDDIYAKNKISQIQSDRSKKGVVTKKLNPNYEPPLSPFSYEYWIKKGITNIEDIKHKINSQRKLNIEYWLEKGFNEDDSKLKVSEYQKENSEKRKKKWENLKDTYEYKKQSNTNINYYIDKGYSVEESEKLLKDRQTTFTLNKCIIKYGMEKGKDIYNKRQKDWIKKMFNETTCMATGRSMSSDKFIENLILSINNTGITNKFLYGKNEKFIYDKLENKGRRYDFCFENKIIEFHGDFWHSNPKIFKKDDIHKVKKIKCSDIWKQDKRKIKIAQKYNYKVLIIWESDYNINKEKIIKKCKKFLEI